MILPRFDLTEDGKKGILVHRYQKQTSLRGVYAVSRDGKIMLYNNGIIVGAKGYRWDFGSGAVDTPAVLAASLVHDMFCDLIAQERLPSKHRKAVDKIYMELLKEGGMSWIRRQWQYRGIRMYVRFIKPIWG